MESFIFTDDKQEARYDAYVEGGTMSPDDARRVLGIVAVPEQESQSEWTNELVSALPVDDGEPLDDWSPTGVLKTLPEGPVELDWRTVQYKD